MYIENVVDVDYRVRSGLALYELLNGNTVTHTSDIKTLRHKDMKI